MIPITWLVFIKEGTLDERQVGLIRQYLTPSRDGFCSSSRIIVAVSILPDIYVIFMVYEVQLVAESK